MLRLKKRLILKKTGALILALICGMTMTNASEKLIIAHRGASGYVPEHTLEAVAMAHAFGADYIEQDLVLTKDGVPIVLHDIELEPVTDVREKFPTRNRADGKFYAIDFTLDEIKSLNVHERRNLKTGEAQFPTRFPITQGQFKIPTFEEELRLIQGLNKSRKTQIGIYPEIKSPSFHRNEGTDLSAVALRILAQYGYQDPTDKCFVQCFEWSEILEIRKLGYRGQLIFLTGGSNIKLDNDEPAELNLATMKRIAEFANGIGPSTSFVVSQDKAGTWTKTNFVDLAHQAGLKVHPYTIRADVPMGRITNPAEMFQLILHHADADGVFTDHPDAGVRWKNSQPSGSNQP